jgi:hypothetical protein
MAELEFNVYMYRLIFTFQNRFYFVILQQNINETFSFVPNVVTDLKNNSTEFKVHAVGFKSPPVKLSLHVMFILVTGFHYKTTILICHFFVMEVGCVYVRTVTRCNTCELSRCVNILIKVNPVLIYIVQLHAVEL